MEFPIQLRSVQDVEDFVSIATSRSFPVTVTNHYHSVNATNFMEMFSLDMSNILYVSVECSEEEFYWLKKDAERFLVW